MSEILSEEDKFEDDDGSVGQARKNSKATQSMSCAPGYNPEEDESDDKESVNPGLEEDESGDEDSGRSNDVAKSKLGGSKQTGEFGITLSLIIHRHLPNTHTYP